jgi:two-component system, OmpR family, KDP operon response regulator KdpE
MSEKILVVEDSPALRQSVTRLLEAEMYEVVQAADGLEGLQQAGLCSPDLIIMDVNMPRMGGLEALQRLREFSAVPVLMLSVRNSQNDRVIGLDTGADDYLAKPFGVEELLARVRALLRRQRFANVVQTERVPALRLGGGELTIDPSEHRVLFNGQLVRLTPLEARLLFKLAERPGVAISRQELLSAAWEDDPDATDENLKLYILYLRRKLEPDPTHPRYILTARGLGYQLAAV